MVSGLHFRRFIRDSWDTCTVRKMGTKCRPNFLEWGPLEDLAACTFKFFKLFEDLLICTQKNSWECWGVHSVEAINCRVRVRVYQKNMFFKNKEIRTHQASAWGLVWRDPKGFLISTKFRGSSSHFRFDHFYIVDFHSALTFPDRDLRSEGWVKIYNVKMVKTEMARGPPKLCRN